ncbi:VOC family protein [Prosthecobacter sp.]|jgi:PhnB protein|uniref:VOC family protein n=1 Tax=Prosthecobacter sp. TaxID=1965333 RepID=UPI0037C62378
MSQTNEPTVCFSLTCKSAAAALDFYARAFGAVELYRLSPAPGLVPHAEFMIGTTHINISDEFPPGHAFAIPEGGLAPCVFTIQVDDCDQAFARALAAGGSPLTPSRDQFWGKRTAMLRDPFGYRWSFSQHLEDVPPDELMKRAQAFMSEGAK